VLTTDERAGWLDSRPWLPRRPHAVAPVFSNLPQPTRPPDPAHDESLLGLFGYSDETTMALVLDVLGGLLERGTQVRLRLLGAPGERSPTAEAWRAAAASRQLQSLISFSGVLPAQALADELGACDVLLFADRAGPTSRKGTLAGSLASGRPVVATDGPQRWAELVSAEAALVVDASVRAMVDAVVDLLGDAPRAARLGARGRAFAERTIGVGHSARVVRELLDDVLDARV
jgi:glycosyltransferase involved in cell wall biosynthesis